MLWTLQDLLKWCIKCYSLISFAYLELSTTTTEHRLQSFTTDQGLYSVTTNYCCSTMGFNVHSITGIQTTWTSLPVTTTGHDLEMGVHVQRCVVSLINVINTPSSTICFFWHNLQNLVLPNGCLYIKALTYSNLILWSWTVMKLITLIDQKRQICKLWWDLKCKPIKLFSQRLELFLAPNHLTNCQLRLWTEHTSMLQVQ